MNKVLQHIRTTVTSGILFLIPAFVMVMIIQNLYAKLTGFGAHLAKFLGLPSIGHIGAVSIATSLIIIALIYLSGLLVKISKVSQFRNWLDENVLQFIPGYINYKVKMEEKVMQKTDHRPPVLVRVGDISRPGFLTDRSGQSCVVYIPSAPDTNTGEIWVVPENLVTILSTPESTFKQSIMHNGKNILS
jgi:uncharacterized membrane protein